MSTQDDTPEFDLEKIKAIALPFDFTDHLKTDADICGYLEAIMEDDGGHPETDTEVLRSAIRHTIAALRKRTT